MNLIHHLHTAWGTAAGLGKLSLESISVLCVAWPWSFTSAPISLPPP